MHDSRNNINPHAKQINIPVYKSISDAHGDNSRINYRHDDCSFVNIKVNSTLFSLVITRMLGMGSSRFQKVIGGAVFLLFCLALVFLARNVVPLQMNLASNIHESKHSTTHKRIIISQALPESDDDSDSHPWRGVAPTIDVAYIPQWLEAYVAFHKQSLAKARNAARARTKDTNNYMVFLCLDGHSCSGTANQQRAIFAALVVSILTKRVFLIDIIHPVRLDQILNPNLLEWNFSIPNQKSLPIQLQMKSTIMNVRNANPAPLNSPSQFKPNSNNSTQLIYINANGPPNLRELWKTNELQLFMNKHYNATAVEQPTTLKNVYKYLFFSLYKPSKALMTRMMKMNQQLSLSWNTTFVAMHIRTGDAQFNKKKIYNKQHFEGQLQDFLDCANKIKKSKFQHDTPILLVADKNETRIAASAMDPFVIYANSNIVHTSISKLSSKQMMDGMLNVWVDIFLLARANVTVKTKGSSFSELGGTFLSAQGHDIFATKCM